jgi:hypothetical protein
LLANDEEVRGMVVCSVLGTWTEQLSFNDRVYWRHDEFQPLFPASLPLNNQSAIDDIFVLPSDSRFRADINALRSGDIEAAQAAKSTLEQAQRTDRKLREAHILTETD